MKSQKINFENSEGQILSGKLEFPTDQKPQNFALFAHCFTCNKNLTAIRNISKALTAQGFAVLSFDFTGLGQSEGDFEDTNFSGNIQDLVAASNYLEKNHQAPQLLVGHSLGGAAAIFAASQLPNIKAVATIGAPSNPTHVTRLFKGSIKEITDTGHSKVNIGGRDFTIKKQFIEDLQTKSLPQVAKSLRKALLVMHSPQDTIVGIKNAEEIYLSAHHPKSFISLDQSDHLLSQSADSRYVGELIAGWASRYLGIAEQPIIKTKHQVAANLDSKDGFTTHIKAGNHYITADEPTNLGGNNYGPSPYELVSAGLSACTAMTLNIYAKHKKWDVKNIQVHINYAKKQIEEIKNGEKISTKLDTFDRELKVEGNLDHIQLNRLVEIANKCPVHKTLSKSVEINTALL